jgi:hypothetical protein
MAGWIVERWPSILMRAGFVLFALACVESYRLPIETIAVGPALMLAGAISSVSSEASGEVPDPRARSSR